MVGVHDNNENASYLGFRVYTELMFDWKVPSIQALPWYSESIPKSSIVGTRRVSPNQALSGTQRVSHCRVPRDYPQIKHCRVPTAFKPSPAFEHCRIPSIPCIRELLNTQSVWSELQAHKGKTEISVTIGMYNESPASPVEQAPGWTHTWPRKIDPFPLDFHARPP